MLQLILGLHSLWRWVVLLAVLAGIIRGLVGWSRGGAWSATDRQLTLLATTAIDIQFLLGVLLWLGERRWSDGVFFGVIHPVVMIAALAIAHIAATRVKRESDPIAKFRTLALGLIVVMILVTAAIPSASWSRVWA